MKKNIIKAFTFIAVLCICLMLIFRGLWLWDDGYSRQVFKAFYDLPDNSVDVVYIGSSAAREFYNASAGYFKEGIACYPLATSNQPVAAAEYLIRESLKSQSPQLFLIELRAVINKNIFDADIRKTTDSMHFSRNRLRLIDALLDQRVAAFPEEKPNKWDYYFSYSTYHSRWEDLTADDFPQGQVVFGHPYCTDIDPYSESDNSYCTDTLPVDPYIEDVLQDLFDYCRTLPQEVVFVCSPAILEEDQQRQIMYAGQLAEQAGFRFWNMNTPETVHQIGLDYALDFQNPAHVNSYGALKVTSYMAKELHDEYQIPDRRGGAQYSVWIDAYMEYLTHLVDITDSEPQTVFLQQFLNS